MERRNFMKYGAVGIGGLAIGAGGAQMNGGIGGSVDTANGQDGGGQGDTVSDRGILTATAKFDPLRPEIAKMVASEMQELGVSFEANPLRYEENTNRVIQEEPDYDMWLVRISSSPARIEPSFHTLNFYHSEAQHNQGWNWMGYENPEVDFLSELQGGEMNKTDRQRIVYRIQKKLRDESPVMQVTHPYLLQFYRKDNVTYDGPYAPGEGINSFWAKVGAQPENRSVIREAWTSTLNRLNPLAATDVLDVWFIRLIYSRLLRVNPEGVPEPHESKEYNLLSQTELEVVLDENLTWHDGDPVTAEDVKFTFELYKQAKAPYYNSALKQMESVEATDEFRVKFTLKEPTASFPHSALAGVMLLKKEKWQQIAEENDALLKYSVENPLGSGPFVFESWNRGGELELSRNENFVPEPPKIKRLVRTNRDSVELALKAAEQNEVDVVPYGVTPDLFQRASESENIGTNRALSIGYYGLFFNCDRLPFTDVEFRRAMQYVVPREQIIEQVFGGEAKPGTSIISPGNQYWNNPNLEPYPYDPEKAKQILRDAGYTWDSDGNLRFPTNMEGVPSEEEVTIPVPE